MGLTDRLRDLDQKLLPGTREPEEDAETYLRRVAASRAITPAQAGDVMAALRVYFDVQPATGDDDGGEEDGDGEQKDEAAESGGDEKDESDDGATEDDEADEKSDEES